MTIGEIRVHEAAASPTDPNLATDPALWPAHRQAAAIRARELSSRELLDAMVARIGRLNPTYNAVVTLDIERGRRLAAAADETIAHGYDHGPLHGLPITVKDALDVAGMRSTGGAAHFADRVPDADALAVANVVGAGAFCFGKTNVPEWSGDIQTYNELFGTTNNPWDVARTPGGSSGGAATAVALGMTAFEIGTDIGGSVRIPAAYTGMAGHKPSYGLVPTGGYLDGPDGGLTEPDINVHGPIARSVDDLDLLLGVLASPAPDRAVAWRVAAAASSRPDRRLPRRRVGRRPGLPGVARHGGGDRPRRRSARRGRLRRGRRCPPGDRPGCGKLPRGAPQTDCRSPCRSWVPISRTARRSTSPGTSSSASGRSCCRRRANRRPSDQVSARIAALSAPIRAENDRRPPTCGVPVGIGMYDAPPCGRAPGGGTNL